ncbi:MAG: amidohydrolase family protein, partial [Acidimicrobiia bacterium]|nr:amidohydrolase family protein [Acidimicrobiia bacterium]
HLAGDAMPHLSSPTDLEAATLRAEEALGAGVTLLFDKGWSDETVLDLVDRVDPTGRPHIEAAGTIISTPDGYYQGFGREIDPGDIEAEVGRAIGKRADWVKLIGDWPRRGVGPQPNFTQSQLEDAVRVAEAMGARVAIHTMAREVPAMAVAAGVHSIEHGLFLDSENLDDLAARGAMWVPTISQVEATAAELRPGSSGQALLEEGVANACRLVPLAVEAGVTVLAGSDLAVSSAEVVEEVLRIARCGVDAASALSIAAGGGHDAVGRSSRFELGFPADAVFFPENPRDDLEVLRSPAHVIRGGALR